MPKIKANEDVFKGQVITWIKKQIDSGGLSFKNAINDPSLSGLPTVRFPDVLLTLDSECRQPFCGWELKTPVTDVRDKKLLADAVEKAQTLKAKYFVTWNMQTAIIWRTPEGTRATANENDKVREFPTLHNITDVNDIRNSIKALLLEDLCTQLLRDLDRLYRNENENLLATDTTIFVGLVGNAAEQMAKCLSKDLDRARGNKAFDIRLRAWATKQGVSKYDQDYYSTLAQQMTYKIIGKILFYMTLRWLGLPQMELSAKNYKIAVSKMRTLFQQALEVDYQAIFEPDITDEIELSTDTAKIIIDLTEKLTHWSFELMPLDVIGNIFEKLIPQEARHSLGQYFTPENLVDLIVGFCVRGSEDYVMDPTCGTGTFLMRGYNRLRHLGMSRKPHHQLLNQVWGFDIAGFPAELATINLCRQDFSDYLNFPRVLASDFFDVMPGDEFEFPPPKKTAKTGERIKIKIPKFDAMAGNFPFIRQELIEKVEKGYKKRLERVLFESWGRDYPQLFISNNGHELRLSGQADIYAYMFFHAAAHLKVGGRMGFITSNSWLDVAYGYELQKFFLSKFKLVAICESRCEPWFEQSAVNTVFAILERSDDIEANKNNLVRFVKLKKPLKELFPENVLTDAQARWIRLEQFVAKIEGIAATGKISEGSGCRKFNSITREYIRQPEIISYEDEDIRVRIIRQEDLQNEVERAGQTVKWGQYLRAPDIYFEILEKCADKFVPLAEVADIRRGITTGINEFFYLDEDKIKHWGIEKEFLKSIVTSTKEIPAIFIDEKKLTQKVFLCGEDKKGLRGTNALKYIRWGEEQVTEDGKKWLDVPSVQGRTYWYTLSQNEVSDFLILRFIDRRHYAPVNPKNTPVGDVVFVGQFKEKSTSEFGCAFLNSALTALFAEVSGRANLGDGLLTTYGPEIGVLPLPMKDIENISQKNIEKTISLFRKLGKRNVLPFDKEMQKSDRKEFEKSVFECLGLGENEYETVCKAVNELIEERHLLPKMRTVRKKKRVEQNLDKLKEEIIEEILPGSTRNFPDSFIRGWPKSDCKELSVPAGSLKLGESFFDRQQICDENGRHLMDLGSKNEGKFIVYAKKKDQFIVKIPNSLETIGKAVQDYELYLKDLKQKLYTAFIEKCGDHNVSENLTRQVFEEFNLPDIG